MSQAEIAGGKVSPKGELPRTGYRLRDFALKTTDGHEVHLSDYRGRSNLILTLEARRGDCAALIRDLASHYSKVREEQADVLLITSESAVRKDSLQVPFPILSDTHRLILAEYGLQASGEPIPGVFIADRFGELVASYVGTDITNATAASILKWLEFINSQCPECEPPEWPLEE